MSIVRHADPDAFALAAQPMFARSEASGSTLLARATAMKLCPEPGDADAYLATYDANGAFGVALRRGETPLMLEESDTQAAAAFAHDIAGRSPELTGVVGALDACEAFARVWRERTGRVHTLRFHLRHHELTTVSPVAEAPGTSRVADADDAEWVIASQLAFNAEVGMPETAERVAALTRKRIALGCRWIWDDGRPVAYAGWWEAGEAVARIAPVYTVPDARGHGYATGLVARLSQWLLDEGRRKLFLVTDVANPTSNAIYARIGFRPANDFYHFYFVKPD